MNITFVHIGREHIGIEYLSAILKKSNHQVSLVYDQGLFSKEDNVFHVKILEKVFQRKNIPKEVFSTNPGLVVFSVYSTNYQWACKISSELKKIRDVPILFGGIHATLVPEHVIKNPFVDFVYIGDGEVSFLQFIFSLENKQSLQGIPNLYYKKAGNIIKNPIDPFFYDLDSLPLPDKDLFAPFINYEDDYMIVTTRGCPFSCSYCCESYYKTLSQNHHFRRRSVRSVIDELSYMKKKYNFKEVMFFDSIFFTDKIWLKELLEQYTLFIGVPFRCLGHIKYFDYDIGEMLKESGCYCINFGIQSFNEDARKNLLNRHETNNEIAKVFQICDSLKLSYDVDIILGLPNAREEDYELPLIKLKDSQSLNRIKCYNLAYFPKLPILEIALKHGNINQTDIRLIEEGEVGDFFHNKTLIDEHFRKIEDKYRKIYKIYSLLPCNFRKFMINRKMYGWATFVPNFIIIFLQFINSVLKKDYRFYIYISRYRDQLKKTFKR